MCQLYRKLHTKSFKILMNMIYMHMQFKIQPKRNKLKTKNKAWDFSLLFIVNTVLYKETKEYILALIFHTYCVCILNSLSIVKFPVTLLL